MTFDSYHWHGARTGTPALERARERLASSHDRAAFELLLRSGDPVAAGIALDQYSYADASTRHGTDNPYAGFSDEVFARAREILRGPPSPASLGAEPGANHASALGALLNAAEPEDSELIVCALEQASTVNLRFAAAFTAGTALEKSPSPDERLVAALAGILLDETTVDLDSRRAAVSALGGARSAAATDALLRATRVSDISLQASAALHLLDRDLHAHRAHVEALARSWPEDPPYPAGDVFELLAEAATEAATEDATEAATES
jgi:hypothetical protein